MSQKYSTSAQSLHLPHPVCFSGRRDIWEGVCCDCISGGGEGRAKRGRKGEGFVYFCFLMVTAPPEPTGGKETAEREREMMEGRAAAVAAKERETIAAKAGGTDRHTDG